MSKLTVAVTVLCGKEQLKYTLEGIVEQSVEDFDVMIMCGKVGDDVKELAEEYCREYVGFELKMTELDSTPALRNACFAEAETELVWCIDGGDYISPDSVENVLAVYEETGADIITTRYYISAEGEPRYLDWADMLATVPHIDKFDRALLNTLDLSGKVYKKKFYDLYSLRFPEQPVFYNASFLVKCLFGCDAKVAGVAGAIYDRRSGVYLTGFEKGAEPCAENLRLTCALFDEILGDIKGIIEEDTGSFDGDEYTFQEMLFVYFETLTDRFYRYFWYLTDEDIITLRDRFEALTALMVNERKKKIGSVFADLRFPAMYTSRADAAALPAFSLLADFTDVEAVDEFIDSLFIQKLPFFELFIRESLRENIPERWLNCENVYVLPDENFFAAARAQAKAVPINVKDPSPFDPKLLSELSLTKTPKAFLQYAFASKRKKYTAKTFLKNKGLSLQ